MTDPLYKETNPLPERDQDDIRVYRCSKCEQPGHSRRTCGQTPEQRAASRRRKR